MPSQLPDDAPSPRICLIVKNTVTQEYGYNLHAEKGKPQFIGTVDVGSPADRGGLRPGDRIFAVNGHSIIGENHRRHGVMVVGQCVILTDQDQAVNSLALYFFQSCQISPVPEVVQRIKENPLQCELLVISEEGAEWYKKRNIPITLSLPNVIRSNQVKQEQCAIDSSIISLEKFASSMTTNIPKPRLCILRKHDPTEEFGFNLHAEKNRGHFVGAVDKYGIGERAGLQMGQRIVGVNGHLIYPSTAHKEVVSLIKKNPLHTELLVASEEIDHWYTENHMEYSFNRAELYGFENASSLANESTKMDAGQTDHFDKVERISLEGSKESRQNLLAVLDGNNEESEGAKIIVAENKLHPEHVLLHQRETPDEPESDYLDNSSIQVDVESSNTVISSLNKVKASIPPLKQETDKPHAFEIKNFERCSKEDKNGVSDIYKLSAGEARSRLMSRKKDPRRDIQMSLQEKYQLVSNM